MDDTIRIEQRLMSAALDNPTQQLIWNCEKTKDVGLLPLIFTSKPSHKSSIQIYWWRVKIWKSWSYQWSQISMNLCQKKVVIRSPAVCDKCNVYYAFLWGLNFSSYARAKKGLNFALSVSPHLCGHCFLAFEFQNQCVIAAARFLSDSYKLGRQTAPRLQCQNIDLTKSS